MEIPGNGLLGLRFCCVEYYLNCCYKCNSCLKRQERMKNKIKGGLKECMCRVVCSQFTGSVGSWLFLPVFMTYTNLEYLLVRYNTETIMLAVNVLQSAWVQTCYRYHLPRAAQKVSRPATKPRRNLLKCRKLMGAKSLFQRKLWAEFWSKIR